MAAFINLTRMEGSKIWVNVDKIASFEEARSASSGEFCVISIDGISFFVRETYSEVESLVREAVK